jgi:hypothetical protein
MSAPTAARLVRPALPPMPPAVADLPIDGRGYPVPWFVAWIDGAPDFRVIGEGKIETAVREHRCWICGRQMGTYLAFVVGPMCAVNRISSEPPSHRRCAEFAAQACPFLAMPTAQRREGTLPAGAKAPPGTMLLRNPGVALVWVTKRYETVPAPVPDGSVGALFQMGVPTEVMCFAEGRRATPEEIRASVDSGVPLLRAAIPPNALFANRVLDLEVRRALELLGVPTTEARA